MTHYKVLISSQSIWNQFRWTVRRGRTGYRW